MRNAAALGIIAVSVSGCAMWPLSVFDHHDKQAALQSDESDEAWHIPPEAMSKKVSSPKEVSHFASISMRQSEDHAAGVLRDGDPRRLSDLHRVPVPEVGQSALEVLPGTVQSTHVREVHSVMVGYKPRHFVKAVVTHSSILHVPEIASQGLHRPTLSVEVN